MNKKRWVLLCTLFVTAVIISSTPSTAYAQTNTPPSVNAFTPNPGVYFATHWLEFFGGAVDTEDGPLNNEIVWTSNVSGYIGTGYAFPSTLPPGDHTITASVTDSGGLTDTDTITGIKIVTSNQPPDVTILTPSNSDVFSSGEPVTFQASAIDDHEGDLSENIFWVSDDDDLLGTGPSITTSQLSVGWHIITALVYDGLGYKGQWTVAIEIINEPANLPPAVTITSPSTGSEFTQGDSVTFTGSSSDPEDGDMGAQIQWTSSKDGAIGSGASITTNLSVGTHTITATVTDNGGLSDTDVITVTINEPANLPPAVGITSPSTGSEFTQGDSVTFTGSSSDPEDGDMDAQIQWTSSKDGAIGSGASITTNLSVGTHTITATVTDNGGLSDTDVITVTINEPANLPPAVTITSPSTGSEFTQGDSVTFTGSSSDPEDGDMGAQIQWTSSKDGAIGSGASITTNLSVGTHTITATVTDNGGLSDTDVITVTINEPANLPPAVGITSPSNGSEFTQGDSVTFSGWAADPEQGGVGSSLQWTSSLDGAIGTGKYFNKSNLSVGTHTITATVTDNGGLSGSDQLSITIQSQGSNLPPRVGITSPSNGSEFTQGDSVTFSGWAAVPEQGGVGSSLQWTSSRDGTIGTGKYFNKSNLSVGTHTITATVTDNGGLSGSDQLSITIQSQGSNLPPRVGITSPTSVSGFMQGDSVTFSGWAADPEQGGVGSSLQWTSSLDGAIGTGKYFNKSNLSVGTHTITATVTDNGGLTGVDSLTIFIDPGVQTTVTITNPESNERVRGPFTAKATVSGFEGPTTVSFFVDGNLVGTDQTPDFEINLHANQFSKGEHTMVVNANDGSHWNSNSIVFSK